MKKVFKILPLIILIGGLIAGIYYSTQQSGFELRKKASEISGSQFILRGPASVKPGEKFSVDLVLDTSTDPQYTISAADAIVLYSTNLKNPPSECNGKLSQCPSFMPPPDYCPNGTLIQDEPSFPCQCAPPRYRERSCRWIKQNFSPKWDLNSQFNLIEVIPGKIFESYPTLPKSQINPRPYR